MTRRERFYNTVTHQKVDRPVFDLYGSPQTTILSQKTVEGLKKHLGITSVYSESVMRFDDRILQRLNIDTRMTGGFPTPPSIHTRHAENRFIDCWGIEYAPVADGHYEICKNPLRDLTLDEISCYAFPDANGIDKGFYENCASHAKYLYENTDYIIVAEHPCLGVFELGCWMFGFDDFLYRLAAEPETVKWFFDKIYAYQEIVIAHYYGALGRYIHCTTSGDDFGTQKSTFMSLQMFRDQIAPYYKKRVALTKSLTDARYQHHTCGSVYDLIPTLAECGIDIINPIQPGTYKMEPERLKRDFGGIMSFWGGIDTQYLLVNGSYDEVKREVKRILEIFGTDGGYILSPAHCIQEDVPPENVAAIYEAANDMY